MEQDNQQIVSNEQQDLKGKDTKRLCQLFLKRKNRFCKFECEVGLNYCHHHSHENALILGENGGKQSALQKLQNHDNIGSAKNEAICQGGRVPCPLDPNHNVDVNKLDKHLKKCQSQKERNSVENNIWYSKGINNKLNLSEEKQLELLGEEQQKNNDQESKKFLQQLYSEQAPKLKDLILKIEKNFLKAVNLYKELAEVNEMTEEELFNYLLDITDDMDQEKIMKKLKTENQAFSDTQKDHRQVCKMVEVLKSQNLWSVENIYIEFGAGKGLLSHGIAKSFQQPFEMELTCERLMESMKENSSNCKMNLKKVNKNKKSSAEVNEEEEEKVKEPIIEEDIALQNQKTNEELQAISYKSYHACHVLLELESRRNKMDRLHRDNPFYLRYRTNILDYNVNSLHKILAEKNYPYINKELQAVGVSKHMCGGATDLSINTLLNCENPQKFEGMMIATCCHHRCNTETYTNNDFLQKELNYTPEDLEILFFCSSWYSSGLIKEEMLKKIEQSEGEQNLQKSENTQVQKQQQQCSAPSSKEWLSPEKKSQIGKMVKRTIDIGRILNLVKKGKKGRIVKYCDFILSPENFVIIAK